MVNLHTSAPYVFNLKVNLGRVVCIINFKLSIIQKYHKNKNFSSGTVCREGEKTASKSTCYSFLPPFRLTGYFQIVPQPKFLSRQRKDTVLTPGFFTRLLHTILVAALKLLRLNKIYL